MQGMTSTTLHDELDSAVLEDQLGLADRVVDAESLENSVQRFAQQHIVLPTFGELADPSRIPASIVQGVDKDAADPATCSEFTGTTTWTEIVLMFRRMLCCRRRSPESTAPSS